MKFNNEKHEICISFMSKVEEHSRTEHFLETSRGHYYFISEGSIVFKHPREESRRRLLHKLVAADS